MFRKKGENLRRRSLTLKGLKGGIKDYKNFEEFKKSNSKLFEGFGKELGSRRKKNPVGNVKDSSSIRERGNSGSNSRVVRAIVVETNSFEDFIVEEYQKCFKDFMSKGKKQKDIGKMIKGDKKWIKHLLSGAMDQMRSASLCEEHYKSRFDTDVYPIRVFLQKFCKHVRAIVNYQRNQLYFKIGRTVKDFASCTPIILDRIIMEYSIHMGIRGVEKKIFPVNIMRESIRDFLYKTNGSDFMSLLRTHYCDYTKQCHLLRIREFFFLERLPFIDKRVALPDEKYPYEHPIRLLNSLKAAKLDVPEMVKTLEDCVGEIIEAIDFKNGNIKINDSDLSLVIAYCILNADLDNLPAYLSYTQIFNSSKSKKRSYVNLFQEVGDWLMNDVDVTVKGEKKLLKEKREMEEDLLFSATPKTPENIPKSEIFDFPIPVNSKEEEEEEPENEKKSEERDEVGGSGMLAALEAAKLRKNKNFGGMNKSLSDGNIPQRPQRPKRPINRGNSGPIRNAAMKKITDMNDDKKESSGEDEEILDKQEEEIRKEIEVMQTPATPSSTDFSTPTFVGEENNETTAIANKKIEDTETTNNDSPAVEIREENLFKENTDSSSSEELQEQLSEKNKKIEELMRLLEEKELSNKESEKRLVKMIQNFSSLKEKYVKTVNLAKKLKEQLRKYKVTNEPMKTTDEKDEEISALKKNLKKAISKIMEVRKKNSTLKDKVKELSSK